MREPSVVQTATDAFVNQIDSDVATCLEACVHCGECAEACHFHEATNDPRYTPTCRLTPLVTEDCGTTHRSPGSTACSARRN